MSQQIPLERVRQTQATFVSRNAASHLCSDVRSVGVSLECLATLNSLLDEILARVLAHAHSFRLALLRRAILDVIGVSFGQNAITEAEMKLQVSYPLGSYYSGGGNENGNGKLGQFPLDDAFNTLRYNAILKSKYSDPGLQSLTLAATLETKLYESLSNHVLDLGSIPVAGIYMSGVLECVTETICADIATVVVRSSTKHEARLEDLYDAIQGENDHVNSVIQGMLMKDEIELKVNQAEERRRSITSQVSAISRISQATQGNRVGKSRPPSIDTAQSNTMHRHSSSIGARLFSGLHTPVSATSRDSRDSTDSTTIAGRRSSSYLRKLKNTPEICETESTDKKIFDNILNNKDTVKLSLTPTTVHTQKASNMSYAHAANTIHTIDTLNEDHELDDSDEVDSLSEEIGRKPNKKESLIDFLNSTPPWENGGGRVPHNPHQSHHSLPSSVDDEQHGRTPGLSNFSRDLIAFLNTEPPGGTPKPLNEKKSTNKFKSIFKGKGGGGSGGSVASTGSGSVESHNNKKTANKISVPASVLHTAASSNGLNGLGGAGSVSSARSTSLGHTSAMSNARTTTAPKSSFSTLRYSEPDRQSAYSEEAGSGAGAGIGVSNSSCPPPILTNGYGHTPPAPAPAPAPTQTTEKLPPIQSPLPMSTSFTRSPSPQLSLSASVSPASYVHMQQSQQQQLPIASTSSAIADQYAAAVLRRTQSTHQNLNLNSANGSANANANANTNTNNNNNTNASANLTPPLPSLPSYTRPSSPKAEEVYGTHSPCSRSHSTSQSLRRDGKPSPIRKPVPALDSGGEVGEEIEGGERHMTQRANEGRGHNGAQQHNQKQTQTQTQKQTQKNDSQTEKDKHDSTSTNERYSTAVQTASRASSQTPYSQHTRDTDDAYIHKGTLVKMHNILAHAQTADECRLYLDAFLKSVKVAMPQEEEDGAEGEVVSGASGVSGSSASARMSGASRASMQPQQSTGELSHHADINEVGVSGTGSAIVSASAIPMSISEDRREDDDEHTQSPSRQAVEIDHASSQSSLPHLVGQQGSSDEMDEVDNADEKERPIRYTYTHTHSPTEMSTPGATPITTPITPTATSPYRSDNRTSEDNFVTKWLMGDSQAHTGNGIQVEITDSGV
ncbi:hypothetical protein E3P92_02171 [Wallemia ichthyophaga]|uniref:Uncharacterized protein n=1 Tax=Wallemia ichthyophaga (strain EXF-994 / CBS 113033) TaxID=1299270 RepID=R9AMY0_WALI9|nr:uncharacterized protein J056_003036 [Wallemia ichthyophaga EXF-994]EOR03579.1 hypothetical protein J056_003036 [Wallemia ichthyophaga EXF-994]TIB13684.1 hypothetical protein E3P92_02171 [Wallemia ichthyophaga]